MRSLGLFVFIIAGEDEKPPYYFLTESEPFYALYSNDSTLKINNVEFLDGTAVADNNAPLDLSGKNSHLKSQMYVTNGGVLNLKLESGAQFDGMVDDY